MKLDSYHPLQSGVGTGLNEKVYYNEQKPSNLLAGIVHCFWTLKTIKPLDKDFIYTVVPDACIDFIFDVTGSTPPVVMTPSVSIEVLDLGTEFHHVGIRFKPGVLTNDIDVKSLIGNQKDLKDVLIKQVDLNDVILRTTQTEWEHQNILDAFVLKLAVARIVERNSFIENVLRGMQYGLTVDEVADKVGYSSRQLQRKVAKQTGFSPVQLRRIIRFQSVLSAGDYELSFADQSHLIKEFKAVTGVSYASFADKFIDVRKVQSQSVDDYYYGSERNT